jgi:hypothetical protein
MVLSPIPFSMKSLRRHRSASALRAAGICWAKCAGRRPNAVIPSKKSPRRSPGAQVPSRPGIPAPLQDAIEGKGIRPDFKLVDPRRSVELLAVSIRRGNRLIHIQVADMQNHAASFGYASKGRRTSRHEKQKNERTGDAAQHEVSSKNFGILSGNLLGSVNQQVASRPIAGP